MTNVVIIGCGDIGRRVGALWRSRKAQVYGVARGNATAAAMGEVGIVPIRGDLDDPTSLAELKVGGALVYYFAPPPASGGRDTRMRNFVRGLDAGEPPARIVYLSTTGIYGDSGGGWINEDTPPNPQTDRARRRLDAETILRGWAAARDVAWVILRVPGIYGPGRLPVQRLRERKPVLEPAACGYTNRIHAEDLARVGVAAADGPAGAIYNVSDGQPGTMTDYFNRVADALGLPRPPVVDREEARRVMTPAMLSYLAESRRIDNRRMRERLGMTLLYPDLETGLAASIRTMEGKADVSA
jgi:nucleoside-diphosphate-sugar epimerase